jgi:hypothetical protein
MPMIQKKLSLVLDETIGSGAILENGISRRLVFQSWNSTGLR